MTSIRPFSVRMACGGPSLPLRRQAPGGLRSWLPLHEPATSNRGAVRRAADTKGDILRRGGTSPEMVPIAVALERAKRHHRNGKNHHEKQDRESAGSLVLSGRPAQLKVPKQLPSRSPAGSKGPETENSRKKNTIPLLPPPTAVPPSTDTISEVEFDWSRDDYRASLWLLDQKWAYPGGMTPEKKSQRATELGVWIRDSILALGPTFIKIGQLLSARSDLLGPEIIAELSKLQDRVPSFKMGTVREIIEAELGGGLEDHFAYFEERPIAAASLGQVHKARLQTGEEVAVKVQRKGLRRLFEIDLANLEILAKQLDAQEEGRDFTGIFKECETILYEELSYIGEGRRADRFRRNFTADGISWVQVPRVYWQYSGPRVLTLEYMPGIKITNVDELKAAGYDTALLARRMTESYLIQLLRHGFFHADPHPGNLSVDTRGNLVFYDFGMMGELGSAVRENLLELFYGIYSKDTSQVLEALIKLEVIKVTGDKLSLKRSIAYFLDTFQQATARDETIQNIGEDLFAVAIDQPFRFPSTFTFVLRAFSTLEGIGKVLDPTYKFSVVATPYANELLELRDAGRQGQMIMEEFQKEVESRATDAADAPRRIAKVAHFVDAVESGDLKLRVRVLEAERAARKAGVMQVATLNAVAAMGFLNMGGMLFLFDKQVPATSMMILTGVFGVRMALGFRRIKNLERFEKQIKG